MPVKFTVTVRELKSRFDHDGGYPELKKGNYSVYIRRPHMIARILLLASPLPSLILGVFAHVFIRWRFSLFVVIAIVVLCEVLPQPSSYFRFRTLNPNKN